jgi:2-oxoisovalerate dehydrogenase E1 component beta subunit
VKSATAAQAAVQGNGAAPGGETTYLEAIRQALFEEMARDENVFCLGEDIGAYGGAFKVTEGLLARFGAERVIDTPISEIAIVGAAAGAAHMGMRPVCEMQFIDFISCAYDMLTNYVATARYRAMLPCPIVVRGPSGGYVRGGPFHSQNPEAAFLHTPGIKVVYPATASDAKGLIKSAIRDEDCVLFFEHKYLYRRIKEELPSGDHLVPIGKARLAREGTQLSIVTYAATVWKALEAAEQLEREDGLSVEVLDLSRRWTTRRSWRPSGRPTASSSCMRTPSPAVSRARSPRASMSSPSNGSTRRSAAWRRTTCRCPTRRRWRTSSCPRPPTSCAPPAGWRPIRFRVRRSCRRPRSDGTASCRLNT